MDEVVFGRYRLIELIGQGGMGKVYRARDTVIGREVAIKVLPTELGAEPGFRERFRREALTAARLTEPHIIPIHDFGEADGRLYLVMPVIDGTDVASLLKREGPMRPQRAVHVIEQLAAALDAAHTHGLVHRDVKPSNALMTEHDFVYLIDFGIAHDTAATKLTGTGTVVGTVAYMAPERFTTGIGDARADVYSLACVLHECLTGAQPFPGDSAEQQIAGHLTLDPPKPSSLNPAVPAGFDEVIACGMAKNPEQRYQTAGELSTAAQRALTVRSAAGAVPTAPTPIDDGRVRGNRRRILLPAIAAGAMAVVVIAAVVGYLVLGRTSPPPPPPQQTPPPSGQIVLPFTGLNGPSGVAVDSSGAVYVTDYNNNKVVKLAAGSGTPTELPFSGLNRPAGVAVDSAGAVYVTDSYNSRVVKLAAGSGTPTELPFTGLNGPMEVAVDSAGAVYVTDFGNSRVLKLAARASTPTELPFTALNGPMGVAVDSAGTVYVTDNRHNRVLKLAAGSSTPTELPFTALNGPVGVAVDSAGTVYVADNGHNRVLKLAAGSSTSAVLPFTSLKYPEGVAVDSASTVYVADHSNDRVVKLAAG